MTAQASSSVAPSAADHYPRYRWAMVTQLWLHQAFGFVIFSGLGILLPSLQQDLSFGPAQAGLVSAARTVGQVMVFPASIFLVRYPPNRVYGTFLAIAALMAFATGLAPGLPILMGGLFVYSLAVAWSQVPGALVRLQWVPPRELATVQGISQGVGAVGQTFAFAAIPFLLGAVGGWRGVFFIVAGMLAVFSAVWRLSQRERITDRYRAAMGAKPGWTAVRSTLGRKELWLLGGGFMGGAGAYFTALTFLPFYLTQERGMPLTSAGAIVSMLPLGGLAAALTTGFLSDRLGRRKPFVWTAGLALPALYWIMLSPVPEVTLPFIAFVLGYFAWAPFGIINTMPFELPGLTPQQVAMGQSLVQTIGTAGIMIGPVIAGTVAESFGYRLGILTLAPAPIAFALICLLLPETGPAARKV